MEGGIFQNFNILLKREAQSLYISCYCAEYTKMYNILVFEETKEKEFVQRTVQTARERVCRLKAPHLETGP